MTAFKPATCASLALASVLAAALWLASAPAASAAGGALLAQAEGGKGGYEQNGERGPRQGRRGPGGEDQGAGKPAASKNEAAPAEGAKGGESAPAEPAAKAEEKPAEKPIEQPAGKQAQPPAPPPQQVQPQQVQPEQRPIGTAPQQFQGPMPGQFQDGQRGRRGPGGQPVPAAPPAQTPLQAPAQAQPQPQMQPAAPTAAEKAVDDERALRRQQRRLEREQAIGRQQQFAPQGALPRQPLPPQGTAPQLQPPAAAAPLPEIRQLAPVGRETMTRQGGAEVRSQTFRTDEGQRIETQISIGPDGIKFITTRTTGPGGRVYERRRAIERAADNELERRFIPYDAYLRDIERRDPRYGRDRRFAPLPPRQGGLAPRIIIRAPIGMALPLDRYVVESRYAPPELLFQTLNAPPVSDIGRRRYTIDEVLRSERLRAWMPRIDLDTITFEFNSAYVPDDQLGRLDRLADAILRIISARPGEIFLLEGHTDAPGSEIYNLQLSEARAQSVKYALVDAYGIPERNLVTVGYGEEFLKVLSDGPEQLNRRVTLRRITPLVAR